MSPQANNNDRERGDSVLDVIERLTGAAPRVELRAEDSANLARPVDTPSRSLPQGRGHYSLAGEIARGGMGVILRGRDTDLGREVAIKVMHADLSKQSGVVQRFIEEAQISGQLQHPGIVPVYELGLMADERPYFTMKLIRGRTFADILLEREETTSDRRRMLDIFTSICQTIAYAHSRGVIHRDLKPANVMVGAFGEVQVVDWGLAKVLGSAHAANPRAPESETTPSNEPVRVGARETHSIIGSVMGTPAYMPPEQARGETDALDERCDVFALGAILCEVLTGDPPYGGNHLKMLHQASNALLQQAFDDLDRCDADRDLVELCKQCLSARREDRPGDASILVLRLRAYFESLDERIRRAQIEAAEARVKATEEQRARKLTIALAGSVVATVLVAVAGVLWTRSQREKRERTTGELVATALSDAQSAQGARDWAQAHQAISRADAALEAGSATDSMRARVAALRVDIEREVEREGVARERDERNRRLLETLDRIRSLGRAEASGPGLTGVYASRDLAFAEAFREWGHDIDALSIDDAARVLRDSGAVEPICRALDYWATARRVGRLQRADSEQHLIRVALAADDDPERREIRQAMLERDRTRILAIAQRAIEVPLSAPTAATLGAELFAHREYDRAIEVLDRSYEADPGDYSVALLLGTALGDGGVDRQVEALRYYLAARAIKPDSAEAWGGIAEVLSILGQNERAEECYRRAAELDPLEPNYFAGMAMTTGDDKERERLYLLALEINPNSPTTLANFGRFLQMSERPGEAIPHLRRAVELAPWSYQAWNNLGIALAKTDDHEGAIEAYRKALEANGDDLGSRHNLALELKLKLDFEGAEAVMRRAIELAPQHPLLASNYGAILLQLGRDREAAMHLRVATAGDHDPLSISTLALVLASTSDSSLADPAEARRLVESDLTAAERGAVAELALSIANYELGNFDAALDVLTNETVRTGRHPLADVVRAMANLRLGQVAEGRAILDAIEVASIAELTPFERAVFERWHAKALVSFEDAK